MESMFKRFRNTRTKKSPKIFTFDNKNDKKTLRGLVNKFDGKLYTKLPSSMYSSGTRPKTNEMYNNMCLSKTLSPCR